MSKHVLIAEDDTLLADMMGKILRRNDVRVTIAYNGEEALKVIEKEIPDVLLLDILMPVVDGISVMKAMQEKNVECPVIVLTNLTDRMTMETCRKMNVQNYFVKNDIDDDHLWPAVEKYLQ